MFELKSAQELCLLFIISIIQMTVQMLSEDAAREENGKDLAILHQLPAEDEVAHTESVTVTLTQNPKEGISVCFDLLMMIIIKMYKT